VALNDLDRTFIILEAITRIRVAVSSVPNLKNWLTTLYTIIEIDSAGSSQLDRPATSSPTVSRPLFCFLSHKQHTLVAPKTLQLVTKPRKLIERHMAIYRYICRRV